MKIDNSQLQTYIDCPRKYYNRYQLKVRKVRYDEREVDKDFGACIHLALEKLYKGATLDEAQKVFRDQFTGLSTEKAKTPANGERLIYDYWKYWNEIDSAISDTHMLTVSVEEQGTFKLADDVEWLCKIDRVVKNSGGYWVMDHKTTRSVASSYFWRFDPNMQMSGYCEYVRQKYGQCSGAIINAISIGHRERAYRGQPSGFYCAFARDVVNRSPQQLERFKLNALAWVASLRQSLKTTTFACNEQACHAYRGCAYRELCIACDDENVRETLYESYDPFEYLKEEGKK